MATLRRALLAGLVLAGPVLHAQTIVNDSTAAVIAYWEAGDAWTYKVERSTSGPRWGRMVYQMDFRVADATDTTYVLDCTFRDMRVEAEWPEDPRERRIFHRLLTALDGMRFRFSTDETGVPMRVVEPHLVEDHAHQVLQELLDGALDPDEHRALRMALAPMLDPATLAQEAFYDIGNVFFPFGVAYITGRAEEVQGETPNPLGGDPFPTRQVFTMTALDSAAATASMFMHQEVDPKGVDDAIDALINSCGGQGLTGDAREKLRRTIEAVRIAETMEFTVDLTGAYVTLLLYARESTARGATITETRLYTLLPSR
jgi:hypothetical protein